VNDRGRTKTCRRKVDAACSRCSAGCRVLVGRDGPFQIAIFVASNKADVPQGRQMRFGLVEVSIVK
jgi:hypothetical protein